MDSHHRGRESCPRTHTDLKPLQTKADVRRFLDGIRKEFLSSVNVDESGLMDELVQTGVLNYDSDVESLRCKYSVRKDKARRLWTILYTIDHTTFIEEALPALCKKYFHVIPREYWKEQSDCTRVTSQISGEAAAGAREVTCVRCAAKHRVREKTMADLLYEFQLITIGDYRRHTGEPLVRDWDSIFNSLENIPSDKTEFFSRNFQKLLKSYSLTVPHNLEDLIKRGLPCTCSRPPEINNSNDGTETQSIRGYYSDHEHRRGSDVSTEPSQYPESKEDSDDCCSSRTSTLSRSTLSSNTVSDFLPEDDEATGSDHPDDPIGQAGPAPENKTWKRHNKGAMSSQKHPLSSIVDETKKFLDSQLNVHLDSHVPDVDTVGVDRATNKLRAGRNFALHPDVLYKTFRLRGTRKKTSPALREFLQRMTVPSTQHTFHSRIQNETLDVSKEGDYVVPDCDYDNEDPVINEESMGSLTDSETALSESDTENFGDIEDSTDSLSDSDTNINGSTAESPCSQTKTRTESLDAKRDFIARRDTENQGSDRSEDSVTASVTEDGNAKEHVQCLLPDFRRETPAKASLTSVDASTGKYGVKERISSLGQDVVEETAILTELCDLVASSFPLNGDLTDHLQKAQTWAIDEGHTPTLTVTSCLEMDAHLKDSFTRLEKVKQELPASSSQQDSEVFIVCESVMRSCLGLVLGLKMCLVCDSTLEVMYRLDIPSKTDAEDKFKQMRSSARSRMRSRLEDILKNMKTVAEPGKVPDSFVKDLNHLQAILSSILPHLN